MYSRLNEIAEGAKSPQRAFTHEVLYKWQFHFAIADGGYYSFWRSVVASYSVNGTAKQVRTFFERTRKTFTRGAKSFVMLHYMDYRAVFSCRCLVRVARSRIIEISFNRDLVQLLCITS